MESFYASVGTERNGVYLEAPSVRPVLATLGDLVEDVVVSLGGPPRYGSDTPVVIRRRRGGSAANVAVSAARAGAAVRHLGQVGADRVGDGLLAELDAVGVDITKVCRIGSTGTIVVLVDATGERTMLTDRGSCVEVTDSQPSWLDGVTVLHVPFYSFVEPPLSATAETLVGWARERGIAVSIDLSSVAVLEAFGLDEARRLVERSGADVVFGNADEALVMNLDRPFGDAVTIVKRGADPAIVRLPGVDPVEVPAAPIDRVIDTTGAGDAFAAGFLSHDLAGDGWSSDPIAACVSGHHSASELLMSLSRAGTSGDPSTASMSWDAR